MVGSIVVSFSKMLLWMGLCLLPAVIAKNTIDPPIAREIPKSSYCGNEDVLFKIWAILSSLLDVDGKTVNVLSREQIQYILTLIKKGLLENTDDQNVDLHEKLFLLEAALAQHKGVFLNDNRPLQSLLDLEVTPNEQDSKVMLTANNRPGCREGFMKLIQSSREDYSRLASSPLCSDDKVEAWLPNPKDWSDVQSLVHENRYIPGNSLEVIKYNSNNEDNPPDTWNTNVDNIKNFIQNINVEQTEQTILKEPSTLVWHSTETNNPIGSRLQRLVKLAKDRTYSLGNDFTEDLNHAKDVADKLSALYHASNIQNDLPLKLDLTPVQPLRNLDMNLGTVNIGTVNNHQLEPPLDPQPVLQASYLNQNTNQKPQNNLYKSTPFGINSPNLNQSFTRITNVMQYPVPGFKKTIIEKGYTSPESLFTNAKYHPNPYHSYDERPKDINLLHKYYPTAHSNYGKLTENALNIAPISDKIPIRYDANQFIPTNNNFINSYPNFAEKSKTLQNNYPYQSSNNPHNFNFNQRAREISFRPHYSTRSDNVGFQQLVVNPQNSNLFTIPKYPNQNNHITGIDQKFIQNINAPQPLLKSYKENVHNPFIKSYKYSSLSNVQNNNVPIPLTHQASNYKNQPVIDKLAGWISGTNPVKLNSDTSNKQGDIELTYLVKEPPLLQQPKMYFVKFRLPYKAFATRLSEYNMKAQSNLRSSDVDLYKDLASKFNATIIPSDPSQIPKGDVSNLGDKSLVKARYIEPNLSGNGDDLKSVDIINLVEKTEFNNANLPNLVNNIVQNAEILAQ